LELAILPAADIFLHLANFYLFSRHKVFAITSPNTVTTEDFANSLRRSWVQVALAGLDVSSMNAATRQVRQDRLIDGCTRIERRLAVKFISTVTVPQFLP
jgi:hypothetical protein